MQTKSSFGSLKDEIYSFADTWQHEGHRHIPPPSQAMRDQAMDALVLLSERNLTPYRAVLSASGTVCLYLGSATRHVDLEFLGPKEGIVMELRVRGGSSSYEVFEGDEAVEHTVNCVEELFTTSRMLRGESPFWRTAGQAASEVSHWPAWRREGFWAPTRGIQN
jgi:hypothetical protein